MPKRHDLPTQPDGYRAPTAFERRTTDLTHNRRQGWLLRLAERHGLTPAPDTPPDAAALLAVRLLPDLFPDLVTATTYTANTEDADLALDILGPATVKEPLVLGDGAKLIVLRAATTPDGSDGP